MSAFSSLTSSPPPLACNSRWVCLPHPPLPATSPTPRHPSPASADAVWNGFSVRLPSLLATRMPGSVRALGYSACFWPPWNAWGVAQLYRSSRCLVPGAYAVHLWETKVWASLLSTLTPDRLATDHTCFSRAALAVLNGSFDYSPAQLRPAERAEEAVDVSLSRPLLDLLLDGPPGGPLSPEGASDEGLWREAVPRSGGSGAGGNGGCVDTAGAVACRTWAELGECEKNVAFMRERCHRACGC